MKALKLRLSLVLVVLSSFAFSLPAYAQVGQSTAAPSAGQYDAALAAIETKLDARRKELGIPGLSFAIIKDDQIIYMKGLGYKDFEKQVAVTPDTEFAIGSATKAFTALTVLMAQDEGKLSIDDSPKKYLPYFHMYDADADKRITIRDLMSHSSGLNRTDLAMMTGRLDRRELIEVSAQAKPTAKLREKFQYQNIMFTAAGEIASVVEKTPFDKLIENRIFKPLGMKESTMSMKQMEKTKDFSFGYTFNPDNKSTRRLPFRDIDAVAPAGSINSTARDMAQWVRFVLNGGSVNGKRLVSESSFTEWLKPQMKITGAMQYGFGWFLQDWNSYKVVQHGGNIDGFNSLVAMIPEKKLGFVMLTNVSASSLGEEMMPVVWSNLLGDTKIPESEKLPFRAMLRLVGKYRLETTKQDIEIKIVGEDLRIAFPGQPEYKLNRTAPRTFSVEGLPDGFGAKFTPETDDATTLTLTQPGVTNVAYRIKADGTLAKPATTTPVTTSASARDLIGKYESERGAAVAEVKEVDGKIAFQLPGQPPFTLTPKATDVYYLDPLPQDAYTLRVDRDPAGQVMRLVVKQPEGEFGFKNQAYNGAGPGLGITTDELMQKVLDAAGGAENLKKVSSRVTIFEMNLLHQGIQAKGTTWTKAPNKSATETTFTALGKPIMLGYDYFDGNGGGSVSTLEPPNTLTGKSLADAKLNNDLNSAINWKDVYKSIDLKGKQMVGDEECYVVGFTPKEGTKFTEYYSTKTFLLLKREGFQDVPTMGIQIPYTLQYSDYRTVDGITMPFRTVSNTVGNGDIVTTVLTVKHNVPVDDKLFAPKTLKF